MKKNLIVIAALLCSLTIAGQNTIITDTVLQTSTCAGSQIIVPFDASGSFPFGNIFIAQLSNNFGQFTSPVNIGQTSFNIGYIFATIPQSTTFSFLYKVRVISTNPATTGTESPNNIIITSAPQATTITSNTSDTVCVGDTSTLTVLLPGQIYQWSTGDTTQFIQVAQSGNYSVVVTDLTGCSSSDTMSMVFTTCTGINDPSSENTSFLIYPNPTNGEFTIQTLHRQHEIVDLKIYDMLQTEIYSSLIQPNIIAKVNLSTFAKGIYFMRIIDGTAIHTRKIILK